MSDVEGAFGLATVGSFHACLIYDDDSQRREVVAEYLAAGLRRGDLVGYFSDGSCTERVGDWLAAVGVDVAAAEQRGAFTVRSADEAYCPEGSFEPKAMIARLLRRYEFAAKGGYSGSRSGGEMGWVLQGRPGADRFLEYEALINAIDVAFPHRGMCQYDARRFDGATLFQVLRVHPYVIAHGQVVRNPHYCRPEEFLAGASAGPRA